MRKIVILLLCLLCAAFCLCACNEEIGDIPEHYPTNANKVPLTVNLYLPGDPATSENAKLGVENQMKLAMAAKDPSITLKIHFLTDDATYAEEIMKVATTKYEPVYKEDGVTIDTAASKPSAERVANILLVNSKPLMDALVHHVESEVIGEMPLVSNLANVIREDPFNRMKAQINAELFRASYYGAALYSIPNDHTLGSYEYIVIDKAIVRDELSFAPYGIGEEKGLDSYVSYEDYLELLEAVTNRATEKGITVNVEEAVRYVRGASYNDRFLYENDGACIVNTAAKPTITVDEAFKSCFCVTRSGENLTSDYVVRMLSVIYYLNCDKGSYDSAADSMGNILTYGVAGTNYTVENRNGVYYAIRRNVEDASDIVYVMNPLYTGNAFNHMYTEGWKVTEKSAVSAWTKEMAENGTNQNKDVRFIEEVKAES